MNNHYLLIKEKSVKQKTLDFSFLNNNIFSFIYIIIYSITIIA